MLQFPSSKYKAILIIIGIDVKIWPDRHLPKITNTVNIIEWMHTFNCVSLYYPTEEILFPVLMWNNLPLKNAYIYCDFLIYKGRKAHVSYSGSNKKVMVLFLKWLNGVVYGGEFDGFIPIFNMIRIYNGIHKLAWMPTLADYLSCVRFPLF